MRENIKLFLQFHGPMTILIQTRASRLSDVLTSRDLNEIADTQAGATQAAVTLATRDPLDAQPKGTDSQSGGLVDPKSAQDKPVQLSVATIGKDGKVKFQKTGDFTSLST